MRGAAWLRADRGLHLRGYGPALAVLQPAALASLSLGTTRLLPHAEVTQRDLEAVAQQAADELLKRHTGGSGGFWPFSGKDDERQLVRGYRGGWGQGAR